MKKIDIYEIAIKIFGFYLLLPIVNHIGSLIGGHYMTAVFNSNLSSQLTKIVQFVSLITCFLLLLISCACLFATKWIAGMITNDEDKTHELNLNTNKRDLYQIVLLITGLVMTLWALPDLCLIIYNHFSATRSALENPRQERGFIAALSRVLLGIFIILAANPLSNLFTNTKTKDN